MIGAPIQNQRAAVLAQLSASIDAFFQGGGVAEDLPGFEFVPRRQRRDIEPSRSCPRQRLSKIEAARLERLDRIRQLAATMTTAEAMKHTGLSRSALQRASADGGFKFKPDPNRGKGNLDKQITDPAKDKALAERIVAMRDVGVTMAQVCRRLEISYTQIHRIMRLFDIKFPTTAEKRAQRKA